MLPRSLYVHVPFCTRRCSYCDFAVDAVREPPVDAWVRAVGAELGLIAQEQAWEAPLQLDTLYVGGGTPSLLGSGAMARLRAALAAHAELAPGAEFTCEANPESFSVDLARDWFNAGINRISLGAQTFSEPALRWMGRLHGVEGPATAMRAARNAGFTSISIDLIFGLPGTIDRDWSADLDRALALEPDHVSLYGLTAEPGAPLGRWVAEGRAKLADEDRYADEYLLAHERLTAAGFEHYEVSNFARPGHRSRHNSIYWTGSAYAALGPGSHALYPPTRRWNMRSWDAYRDAVAAGRLPIDDEEIIDAAAEALESIWLGLRTDEGLPFERLGDRQRGLVMDWQRRALANVDRETVRLTPTGWLLLDSLALALCEAEHGRSSGREPRIDGGRPLVQISTTSNP